MLAERPIRRPRLSLVPPASGQVGGRTMTAPAPLRQALADLRPNGYPLTVPILIKAVATYCAVRAWAMRDAKSGPKHRRARAIAMILSRRLLRGHDEQTSRFMACLPNGVRVAAQWAEERANPNVLSACCAITLALHRAGYLFNGAHDATESAASLLGTPVQIPEGLT